MTTEKKIDILVHDPTLKGYTMEAVERIRQNDTIQTGIFVRTEKMQTTIWLQGDESAEMIRRIIFTSLNNVESIKKTKEYENLLDYVHVKKRLRIRLCSQNINKKFLADHPIKAEACFDLWKTYLVDLPNDNPLLKKTIDIKGQYLEYWGITKEELEQDALLSLKEQEVALYELEDVAFNTLMGIPLSNLQNYYLQTEKRANPSNLYVLTNKEHFLAASFLLDTPVLKQCSNFLLGGYFIIPSSVHELLLFSDYDVRSSNYLEQEVILKRLKQMVLETNENAFETNPHEILSYEVYHFDSEHGLETGDQFVDRLRNH